MFFAGIVMGENGRDHTVVVIEKVIRKAKKEYMIHEAQTIPPENEGGTAAFIRSVHQDIRFIRKKKVFSQSKRPSKNTYSPPLILIHEGNDKTPVIRELRDNLVPVEAFYFQSQEGWKREEMKILRHGNTYHVSSQDMGKVGRILGTSAITIMPECNHASELKHEMGRYLEQDCTDVFEDVSYVFLPSLFLSLWHCETIRQIKRY